METTITSVRENPLLDRREVELEVDHEGESTPAQEDIKERLAAENNLDLEKIEVDSVYTGYGSNKSRVSLKVYEEFEYDEELERNPEEEQSPEQQEEKQLRQQPSTKRLFQEPSQTRKTLWKTWMNLTTMQHSQQRKKVKPYNTS